MKKGEADEKVSGKSRRDTFVPQKDDNAFKSKSKLDS